MRNFSRLFISLLCFTFIFSNCKKDKEVFKASTDCAINDLEIEFLECSADNIPVYEVNFEPVNPASDIFIIHDRTYRILGRYTLSDLPVNVGVLPNGTGNVAYLKIAILGNGLDTCQIETEVILPDCDSTFTNECFANLNLEIGACCPGDLEAYELTINFDYLLSSGELFEVYDRDGLIGTYRINQLPITIDKFPVSDRNFDFVKICNVDAEIECCVEREFEAPDCGNDLCRISNIAIEMGDCTCEDAFNMTINFDYQNVNADYFDVYGSNGYFGSYRLDQLPVTLENYPHNGGRAENIYVVVNDECETEAEFSLPDCDPHSGDCEISNLVIRPGDCTSDETYNMWIHFQVQNPTNDLFDVFGPNGFVNTYRINDLALRMDDFTWTGETVETLKVCINDNPDCCREFEFAVPDCILEGGRDCLIKDLVVEPGDCTSDSTYVINIDFEVLGNPVSDQFSVYDRGNIYMGTFSRRDLPLRLATWFSSGSDYDYMKICIDGTNFTCCEEVEWKAPPDCS